jgi:hypothetical protein
MMADYFTRVPYRQSNWAGHISSAITGRNTGDAGRRADADQHAEARAVQELENLDLKRQALVRDTVRKDVDAHLNRHRRR